MLDLLTLSTNCLRNITSGDTSATAMRRMDEVYRVFDDVMAAVTNPASQPPVPIAVETVPEVPAAAETVAETPPAPTRPIVRVSIARLDELVRIVRDLVVSRSVIEQRIWEFEQQIEELHSTTRRLQATSAKIETDFEASMLGTQPAISFGRSYHVEENEYERRGRTVRFARNGSLHGFSSKRTRVDRSHERQFFNKHRTRSGKRQP